jgi:hypothetical protein
MAQIRKYLEVESGEESTPDLHFGRTARCKQGRVWIWGYLDFKGELVYVIVTANEKEYLLGTQQSRGLGLDELVAEICADKA